MNTSSLRDKIIIRDDSLIQRIKSLPRPIVFTNGVFDVLHRGHVSYLFEASKLGASLVVAINTDESSRALGKGPDRPLNNEQDRALVLSGLGSVTLVAFFNELTPVDLIKKIQPDIYVKGGDYQMDELEETRVVQSWGGSSVAIPFVDGYSTTFLLNRIRQG